MVFIPYQNQEEGALQKLMRGGFGIRNIEEEIEARLKKLEEIKIPVVEEIDKKLDILEYKDQIKIRKGFIGIPILKTIPNTSQLFEGQLVYVSNASLDRLYLLRNKTLKYVNFT